MSAEIIEWVARELHSGGVGKVFALARYGAFDEGAEKVADDSADEQRGADNKCNGCYPIEVAVPGESHEKFSE